MKTGWGLLVVGFVVGYALIEVWIGAKFWLRRKEGFGFSEIATKFWGSAVFFLLWLTGSAQLNCPRNWQYSAWIGCALLVRAIASWRLIYRFDIFPK